MYRTIERARDVSCDGKRSAQKGSALLAVLARVRLRELPQPLETLQAAVTIVSAIPVRAKKTTPATYSDI